jgi:hypothetical protein
MKKLISMLIFLVGISVSFAQTARIQIIHNAADPAAQEVDIYVNGTLALDNFAFRAATPFIDLPAGVTLNIGIAPGNSTSVNDTLKNFQVVLQENETYVAVANGVLDPNSFSPNPDGREISFTLFAKDNIREEGSRPWGVDFIVLHGATDAPTVDIIAKRTYQPVALDLTEAEEVNEVSDGEDSFGWGWRIVNNAGYGDITNYKRLLARQYILKVTPGDDNAGTRVAALQLPDQLARLHTCFLGHSAGVRNADIGNRIVFHGLPAMGVQSGGEHIRFVLVDLAA